MAQSLEKIVKNQASMPKSCEDILRDEKKCEELARAVKNAPLPVEPKPDPLVDFFTKPAHVPALISLGFGISVGSAFIRRFFFSGSK